MGNVLADLRALCPDRPLTTSEAMRVAELQAVRLLAWRQVIEPPVPETTITSLPRIQVTRLSPLPLSGAARWKYGLWQIVLNGAEPKVRQRFSLCHEFKHVIDSHFGRKLYPPAYGVSSHDRAEQICDYFAACVLMPKMWVRRCWVNETQNLHLLARRFAVSRQAMQTRLLAIGLIEPTARCAPIDTFTYERQTA